MTFGLPVKARARRRARWDASVPEPVKRTPLGAGDQPVDQLGPAHLQLVRRAPMRAEPHLPLDRLHDRGMAMTEQQRAVATEVVDILVAVDVPLARPGSAGRVDRVRQQGAAVVRQPRGDHLAGPCVELGRAPRARPVLRLDPGIRSQPTPWVSLGYLGCAALGPAPVRNGQFGRIPIARNRLRPPADTEFA